MSMVFKRHHNGYYSYKDETQEGFILSDDSETIQKYQWKIYHKMADGLFGLQYKGHTLKECKTWLTE
jgi:hypothetical protein